MSKLLKRLTVLSFLLLFLPFCQMCSDEEILSDAWLKDSPLKETAPGPARTSQDSILVLVDAGDETMYHLTFDELKEKKVMAIRRFKQSQARLTVNGYQLGYTAIIDFDWDIDITFVFTLVIALCMFQSILAFTRRYKPVFIMGCCNAVLLLIPLVLAYCEGQLEDPAQVKYGYYLFYANTLLIMYLSYKVYKSRRRHHKKSYEEPEV